MSFTRCRRIALGGLFSLQVCACKQAPDTADPKKAAAEPVPVATPVERGAVGDSDLRVMLSELASAKACELVRGQFRPLRALDRPDTVTGLIWIRDCKIESTGSKVTFVLSGNGWQWAAQEQHKAGGTFGIAQYVKFGMTATIPGALDLAYSPGDHVLSLWFTPSDLPRVTFTPLGGIAVDEKGAWSSIVGALGSIFAQSPEHLAKGQAEAQGGHQLQKELADGLSVTINLCTGLSRFGLGREPKGSMDKPDAGESKHVPIELQSGALMVFGPQPVGDAGFSANVDAGTGQVHVELACRDQAELVAEAYIEGKPLPQIKTLAARTVSGTASLRVAKASCPVSLIAQRVEPSAGPFTFDWQRPPAEIARSTGGPLIACDPPSK